MFLRGTNDLWNTTRAQQCNVQHYTSMHCAGLHSIAIQSSLQNKQFPSSSATLFTAFPTTDPPQLHRTCMLSTRKICCWQQCYLVSWPTGPTHMYYKWVLHNDRWFLVITATWCLYFATLGHILHRNGTEQNNDASFSCLFHWMYFIYS